jgi:MFS family permease
MQDMAISTEPDRHDGHISESTPLLAGTSEARDYPPSITASIAPQHPKFFVVATICIASIFFIEIGDYMLKAPIMRTLEAIICNSYFKSTMPIGMVFPDPIPEDHCKIPFVQSQLAMLKGWDLTFSCIPGILAAVPYGVMADKYGRKLVLMLGLVGILLGLSWVMVVSMLPP